MPEYEAKYTIKAHLFAGDKNYCFDAKDDDEAKTRAEGYRPEVGKPHFGAAVTLNSLVETRAVNLESESAVKQSLSASLPKQVHFDEQLEHLVDEEGVKYEGRRFSSVSAFYNSRNTEKDAENGALFIVETLAKNKGAEAYELIGSQTTDSKMEYDSTPWSCCLTAILYKSR